MGILLVGLDGSPRAPAVLEAAIRLAEHGQHRIVLCRAVGLPPEMPPAVWRLDEPSLLENLRGHAIDYLRECARSVPKELLADQRVEVGVPWQAVCAAAIATKADMIVVGSHGYGGVDRVLGTTAAKIVNHADCSVLVVRPTRAHA